MEIEVFIAFIWTYVYRTCNNKLSQDIYIYIYIYILDNINSLEMS